MDLRVGEYWKTLVAEGALDPARRDASTNAARQPEGVGRAVRDDLHARDVAMGLGASGPLVSAAREAARPNIAPEIGAATIDVETDADGRITSARVVDAAADRLAWTDVARQLVLLMAAKPLRVPPGARGLRARLRIVAERTLPAGESRPAETGATTQDACDASGVVRRCIAGLPAGVSGTFGDVSNFGAKRSRNVRVEVLSESSI
jgi:hypothetical protein